MSKLAIKITNEELMALVLTFVKIRAGIKDSPTTKVLAGALAEAFHYGIKGVDYSLEDDGLLVEFEYHTIGITL